MWDYAGTLTMLVGKNKRSPAFVAYSIEENSVWPTDLAAKVCNGLGR